MTKYYELYDLCRGPYGHRHYQDVVKFFKELKPEDDLDLLEDEGDLFYKASKHKDGKILKELLKHYVETKLSGDPESYEYKLAKQKLIEVVDDILCSHIKPSEEAMKLFAPYMPEDDDVDSRADELADINDFTYDADNAEGRGDTDWDCASSVSIETSSTYREDDIDELPEGTNTWDNPYSTIPTNKTSVSPTIASEMMLKLMLAKPMQGFLGGLLVSAKSVKPEHKLPHGVSAHSLLGVLLGFPHTAGTEPTEFKEESTKILGSADEADV